MQEEAKNSEKKTYFVMPKNNLLAIGVIGTISLVSFLLFINRTNLHIHERNTQILRRLTGSSREWGQCGGRHWTGSRACPNEGWACVEKDEFYSQCLQTTADAWLPELEGDYLADWQAAYFNADTKEFTQLYPTNYAYTMYRTNPKNEFFGFSNYGNPNIGLLEKSDQCGVACTHTAVIRAGAGSGEASFESWKIFDNGRRIESVYSVETGYGALSTSLIYKGTYRKVS